MDELFEKCKKLVIENIECEEELTELLSISILAILIVREDRLEDIKRILNTLRVQYEEKDLKKQEQERNMDKSRNTYANIHSEICLKGNTLKEITELLASKNNGYITGTLQEIIKGLIKELRSFDAKIDNEYIEKRIGISNRRIGINDKEPQITNETLENAIEEYETKKAIEALFKYLEKEQIASPIIETLQKERNNECIYISSIYLYLLEQFIEDDILQETIIKAKTTKEIKIGINYYNIMMEDEGSFSKLNRMFNQLRKAIESKNDKNIKRYLEMIQKEINIFNNKPKKYRLK